MDVEAFRSGPIGSPDDVQAALVAFGSLDAAEVPLHLEAGPWNAVWAAACGAGAEQQAEMLRRNQAKHMAHAAIMSQEAPIILEQLSGQAAPVGPGGLWFAAPFALTHLDGLGWLDNAQAQGGRILVPMGHLEDMLTNAFDVLLHRDVAPDAIKEAKQRLMPLISVVRRRETTLKQRAERRRELPIIPAAYPPCVARWMAIMRRDGEMPHTDIVDFAAFLRAIGMNKEAALETMAPNAKYRSDTAYQIDHVFTAGDQGKGYKVRSCEGLKLRGACPDSTCPGLSPVGEYYARRRAKTPKPAASRQDKAPIPRPATAQWRRPVRRS